MTEEVLITKKVNNEKRQPKNGKNCGSSFKTKPYLNASQIENSQQIDLCTGYISKILIKYGLRARKIAKKPSISGPKRQKRKESAKKCWSKNANFWKTVVFGRDYA